VDNTFCSPVLQRPIEHGADIVLHSMTKFLNGHADVVAGMLVAKDEETFRRLRPVVVNVGGTMDPHQAWLVLRGLKTLPMRVHRGQENAMAIASMLEEHPKVRWVRYPGLASHPAHELVGRQMDGPGSLLSFEVEGGYDAGVKVLDSVRLMTLAVSLGGIETLIQHPASMTHAGMKKEARERAGITDGLVRLSVGCEDLDDLRRDLEQALGHA
jgi:methionine-gamma-lyase